MTQESKYQKYLRLKAIQQSLQHALWKADGENASEERLIALQSDLDTAQAEREQAFKEYMDDDMAMES